MKDNDKSETALCETGAQASSIMRQVRLLTRFQPIVSIRKMDVVGFEGLSRGLAPDGDRLIAPDILFDSARESGCLLELDRLCRENTLRNFLEKIHAHDKRSLVFMNFEASLLDEGACGSGHLMGLVSELRLDPSNIVIEIVESKVRDITALKKFVRTYRDYGFIIALDDIGAGYSNLDRISLIKPDVLKIDREALKNIHLSYHKQEVFRSITNMARNIGAIVVAEGVETEEEVLQCLELGADLFQGYYFAKPGEADTVIRDGLLREKIIGIAARYKDKEVNKMRECRQRQGLYAGIIKKIVNGLSSSALIDCEDRLRDILRENRFVEALYIVDDRGFQITDTIIDSELFAKRHKLFQPAQKRDDQSMKEYIYPILNTGLNRYTTARYISLATGNICRTVAFVFRDRERNKYILCVDFKEDGNV
jgi:EAL domain-containing protein (putative c-di-GMP-specific phosphodiesterase class I)